MTHQTINGRVSIERTAYWSFSTGTVYPADAYLGIANHRYSVGTREMCCRLGHHGKSFSKASEDLHRTAQLSVSRETIRMLCESEGRRIQSGHRRNEVAASFTADDCADGVMVTGTDGVLVPTVPETQKAARRKAEAARRAEEGRRSTRRQGRPSKGADGAYKEVKILAFYDQNKSKRHVTVTSDHSDALGRMMRREARKVRLGEASFTYAVTDGAKWIAKQYRRSLPMLDEHILDWYHFQENVLTTSYGVYGEQTPKADAWKDTMLDLAWRQGSMVMLEKLGHYERVHTGENRQILESLRGYVQPRVSMTDYPSFRAQGYDCGSGPTESQCGTLTDRIKGAGMRWDLGHAEAMMAPTALDHSRQWQTYWNQQRAA